MPIYEYYCKHCKEKYEKLISVFHDYREKTRCPNCGKALKRLLSAPNFKFVGDGFYKNDYKNKAKKGGKA